MGCEVLSERIGTPFPGVVGAKIHHAIKVTGLFEGLSSTGLSMTVDFGKDTTGLVHVSVLAHGKRYHWPYKQLEQELPEDFKDLATRLRQSPLKLYNFIRDKAKSGHVLG